MFICWYLVSCSVAVAVDLQRVWWGWNCCCSLSVLWWQFQRFHNIYCTCSYFVPILLVRVDHLFSDLLLSDVTVWEFLIFLQLYRCSVANSSSVSSVGTLHLTDLHKNCEHSAFLKTFYAFLFLGDFMFYLSYSALKLLVASATEGNPSIVSKLLLWLNVFNPGHHA